MHLMGQMSERFRMSKIKRLLRGSFRKTNTTLQHRLYLKMKKEPQSQIVESDDHPNDNPEGEKNSKKLKSTIGYSSTNFTKSSNLTSSSKSKAIHKPRTYALQPKIPSYNNDWSTVQEVDDDLDISKKVRKYLLSLHEIHAIYFPEDDLEEVLKRRDDPQQTSLAKALIVFIRSCVIWERVHDFQLGIESYQMKVNLTAPTITLPKRAMDIDELQKFSDATLKRVVWKISVINVEAKHEILKIFLSKQDKELTALLEEEMEERLKYLR
ncbi:hypothetical protein Tco_1314122 [Tanacetum coccineum]